MNYIILIILILVLIDIYYRFRSQSKFNLLTEHLAFVINRYEKILLNKNIIIEDDVINIRDTIRKNVGEQNFLKLKKMVVVHDDIYFPILTDVIGHGKDNKKMLDDVENAIYMMNRQKINKLQNDVHKDSE